MVLGVWLATKEPDFDPNTVTPGVIGFVATFAVAAVVILLGIDMVRRVRRTQYRAEIGELLDAEQIAGAANAADADAPTEPNADH